MAGRRQAEMATARRGTATRLSVVEPAGDTRPHVVVIGGGIGGLTAAWAVSRDDAATAVRVTVLEGSPRVGGKLRRDELDLADPLTVDAGAEAMLATRPEAVALAREVGLDDALVVPATSAATLWSRGRHRPMPRGLVMGVPTDLRSLARAEVLGWSSLLRVPLDHWRPRTPVGDDVSVGAYVDARIGHEVVQRLVEPLLGGVYAGRAESLSMAATVPALFREVRSERSLLAAAARVSAGGAAGSGARRGPVFMGIDGGVGRLPDAVRDAVEARGVDVRTGAMVRELHRTESGWRLVVGATRDAEVIEADAVVLAVPALAASRLLHDDVPAAAIELAGIPYASVAVTTMAFRRSDVAGDWSGSGFLVPPVDDRAIKASTYSSSKWGWLARDLAARPGEPLVVLRASLGRYGEEAVLQRSDEELVDLAYSDLVDAVGVTRRPVAATVTRWGGALPQYLVGHLGRVARIRAAVAEVPGLEVCGAAYDGVGIAAVVGSARTAAARLLDDLRLRAEWRHG